MTTSDIDYTRLPTHIQEGFREFIENHRRPGGFIQACLKNDLAESLKRADPTNRAAIWDIVGFLYNEAPLRCWGSPEKMEEWIAEGGAT